MRINDLLSVVSRNSNPTGTEHAHGNVVRLSDGRVVQNEPDRNDTATVANASDIRGEPVTSPTNQFSYKSSSHRGREMTNGKITRLVFSIVGTVIGGFILALLVAECRQARSTHDAVIRMEERLNR